MRIRIDARPGELEGKLDDVLRLITEMAGGELCKAMPTAGDVPEADRPLDLRCLQQGLDLAKKRQATRIQRVMQRKIREVILARS
jgi:hypothetical protein